MKHIYCPECGSMEFIKKGFSKNGEMRRLLCKSCGKHYSVDVEDFDNAMKEKENKNIKNEFKDKFSDDSENKIRTKVTKRTVIFYPSPDKKVEKKEEPKPKDKNERVKYIYLRGSNVTVFRNLADKLGLTMELIDERIDLYRITNPQKN